MVLLLNLATCQNYNGVPMFTSTCLHSGLDPTKLQTRATFPLLSKYLHCSPPFNSDSNIQDLGSLDKQILSQRPEPEEISAKESESALRQKLSSASSSIHQDFQLVQPKSLSLEILVTNMGCGYQKYILIVGLLRLDLLHWRHCPGVNQKSRLFWKIMSQVSQRQPQLRHLRSRSHKHNQPMSSLEVEHICYGF